MIAIIKRINITQIIIGLLCIITVWQWGQATIIYGKAYLAKHLIKHAWQQTLITGENTKPWPWADTWPVAKLIINTEHHNDSFYILSGNTGNSLAFGPGHSSETALPGTQGSSVVGAHRDTHFSILKEIQKEHSILVQNTSSQWKEYIVNKVWVTDSRKGNLLIDHQQHSLYLITCYPFNQLTPNGSQRLVVETHFKQSLKETSI